jgi:hypothetical protein
MARPGRADDTMPDRGFCLSALKVICPKCTKSQEVGGEIPAGGADHVCLYCRTVFKVRPPATKLADNLPAARETVPRPTDLPVSREAVPRPTDLPVSREAVPRPTDLPVSREAVPRPTDLPVSREAVPRPTDLPVSREAVPRPTDLPVSRETAPRSGRTPRPTLPGWLPSSDRAPNKTPPLGLALDLSMAPETQETGGGPPLTLDLDAPAAQQSPSASGLSLDFGELPVGPPPASPAAAPAKPPVAKPPKGAGTAPVTGRPGGAPPPIPASARTPPVRLRPPTSPLPH